jgi:hypothetical protein
MAYLCTSLSQDEMKHGVDNHLPTDCLGHSATTVSVEHKNPTLDPPESSVWSIEFLLQEMRDIR